MKVGDEVQTTVEENIIAAKVTDAISSYANISLLRLPDGVRPDVVGNLILSMFVAGAFVQGDISDEDFETAFGLLRESVKRDLDRLRAGRGLKNGETIQ